MSRLCVLASNIYVQYMCLGFQYIWRLCALASYLFEPNMSLVSSRSVGDGGYLFSLPWYLLSFKWQLVDNIQSCKISQTWQMYLCKDRLGKKCRRPHSFVNEVVLGFILLWGFVFTQALFYRIYSLFPSEVVRFFIICALSCGKIQFERFDLCKILYEVFLQVTRGRFYTRFKVWGLKNIDSILVVCM